MTPDGGTTRSMAFLGQGFSFAAIVGVMAWVGERADSWLGTDPWLLICGALLGVALAMVDLIRTVSALERKQRNGDP